MSRRLLYRALFPNSFKLVYVAMSVRGEKTERDDPTHTTHFKTQRYILSAMIQKLL